MADLFGSRITGVEHKVDEIKRAIEGIGNRGNQARVTINADGLGVWLTAIACAFMVGVNLVLSGIVIFHSLKIEDLDDKLSAIYMMAPHLKPVESKPE